jgi:hypothetical protein
VTNNTVSLKKSITGLTFIRDSDIRHAYFTKNANRYGGLIKFYRSPAHEAFIAMRRRTGLRHIVGVGRRADHRVD